MLPLKYLQGDNDTKEETGVKNEVSEHEAKCLEPEMMS